MLTIGAFARLAGISVKTLRHYATIGLLPPAHIDPDTGYRSYAPEQLFLVNHILVLKDLGLSLSQIGTLLQQGVPLEQLHGMLRLKRAELQDQIAATHELLARVERRLNQLELQASPLTAPTDGAELALPLVLLGDFVVFPGVTAPMHFSRSYSGRALAHAAAGDGRSLIVCLDGSAAQQWSQGLWTPLPPVGVIATIQEHQLEADGRGFVQLAFQVRAAVGEVTQTAPFFAARCRELAEPEVVVDTRSTALMATARTQMTALLLERGVPADVLTLFEQVENPGQLADLAGYVAGPAFPAQHAIQQLVDPVARLEFVTVHLARLIDDPSG